MLVKCFNWWNLKNIQKQVRRWGQYYLCKMRAKLCSGINLARIHGSNLRGRMAWIMQPEKISGIKFEPACNNLQHGPLKIQDNSISLQHANSTSNKDRGFWRKERSYVSWKGNNTLVKYISFSCNKHRDIQTHKKIRTGHH